MHRKRLAQFEMAHVSFVHPVSSYIEENVTSSECRTAAKKDVEHALFFRCPLTNATRRVELPLLAERKSERLIGIINKPPSRLITFFKRENYL